MSKLCIDGKLVAEIKHVEDLYQSCGIASEAWRAGLHNTRECLTLPTYFCPHCARESLRGVDVSDPSGWRGA